MSAFPRLSGVLAWQPGHLLLLVAFVFILPKHSLVSTFLPVVMNMTFLPLQRREAVEGEEGGGRGLGQGG